MSLTDSSEQPSLRASAGSGIRNGRPSAPVEARPAALPPPRRGASPGLAAILSLLFPGAGQLLAGATRRGLLIALPTVLLMIFVGAALSGGLKSLLADLVQPGVIFGIIVVNGIFAIYHLFAIGDAWRVARRVRPGSAGPRSVAILAIALMVAVGLHGLVGGLGVQAYQTDSAVLAQPGSGITIPAPSFAGATPSPGTTAAPTPTPGPAWAADGRLNLLLIGGDAGPGRYLLRTDTMILLSVDEATGRAALFGLPRNLLNVPVAPEDAGFFKTGNKATDGRFPGLLNALWVWAYQHPEFPSGGCTPSDSDQCGIARGFRAITGAVQQLVGVPLDGAVVVNLNGFVDLVNAVAPKGVWIRTEHVYDTAYPLENGSGDITLDISAGCHQFHGHLLLAYARSRHQDSDYGRMARQQAVLVALLHQIDPIGMLPQVSHLLDVAKTNLILAIPTADIGSLASLAASVDPATVERIGIDPPDYPEYVTAREVTRIQTAVQTVFLQVPATPSPSHATATAHPGPTPEPCGPA
jgi:LCP family protein required for cell wall assembly